MGLVAFWLRNKAETHVSHISYEDFAEASYYGPYGPLNYGLNGLINLGFRVSKARGFGARVKCGGVHFNFKYPPPFKRAA